MPPKKNVNTTEQEWSFFFDAGSMSESYESIHIKADEDQRAALARRFGILGIEKLAADLVVDHHTDSVTYHVTGTLDATVRQACVVTLDPIDNEIEESVEGWFGERENAVSFEAARKRAKAGAEIEITEEADDPEPLIAGKIDLGELVAQHLSLALPDYPHKAGVEYEKKDDSFTLDENSPLKKNPFAALKQLKED